jgi:DNA polymerase III delta prime subunit
MLTELVMTLNTYITDIVGGNQMAVAFILTGILSTAMYLAKELPYKLLRFTLKHGTTSLIVNSEYLGFHHLNKYLIDIEDLSMNARVLQIFNGLWSANKSSLGMGNTSVIMSILGKPAKVNLQIDKLNNGYVSTLTITILGRNNAFFQELMDASTLYSERKSEVSIYAMKENMVFKGHLNKRPMSTIYHDNKVKEDIMKTIRKFLDSEDEYTRLGIPYTLGILLYGPPGTGKTSLVRALATEFELDLVETSGVTSLVNACVSHESNGKIILAEEIDTLTVSRDKKDTKRDTEDVATDKYHERTLSELLIGIDGVSSAYGRILIMTTNHIDKLDSALIRNGRIDEKFYIGPLTIGPFCEMVERFTGERPDETKYVLNDGVKAADVQAFLRRNHDVKEAVREFTNSLKTHIDK